MLQLFTEEARRQARAGAAYVDPGPYERPLVRAFGFSAVPTGANTWDTLLAVNFPAPADSAGAEIDVRAVVRRGNSTVGDYRKRIHVDPAAPNSVSRSVTVLGTTKLTPGQYRLTVVLTDAAGGEIVSAQSDVLVPQVVHDLLTLRGPLLGRVASGEHYLRANPKHHPEKALPGKLLDPRSGFEPLLVEEIDKQDKLLFYWSACVPGDSPLKDDDVVRRTLVSATGEIARAFEPLPLKLEPRGKDVSCLEMLEALPGNTLATGDYRLDVTVTRANGDMIAHATSPLNVR